MSPNIEQSPEIRRQAERLAEIAEKNPQQLEAEISRAPIDVLEAYSREMESTLRISGRAVELIRRRIQDEKLAELETRVSLARVAGIRAPKPPKDSARGWERTWYQILSAFEKNPSLVGTVAGNVAPGFSMMGMIGQFLPSFDLGGRRNLARMDIEDAIAENRLIGEQIQFAGMSTPELQQLDTFLQAKAAKNEPATLADLVKTHLAAMREKNRAARTPDAPIVITAQSLTSTETVQKEAAAQGTTNRQESIRASIGLPSVTSVEFGTDASYENGKLTIPESDLKGTDPVPGSRALLLVRAVREMPNANLITVVPSGDTRLEWQSGKNVAALSLGNVPDFPLLNSLFAQGKPDRVSAISIATNDLIGRDSVTFSVEGNRGVLHVPNVPQALDAVARQLQTLEITADDVYAGKKRWTLSGGSLTEVDPVSFPSRP